jgi:iron complex outermembrane receptor protein
MFNRRIRRAALCGSAAAGALLALAAPAPAVAQTATYSFDIPAQDVSSALIAYGRTSRQQLVFDGTAVRNKQSSTLVGEYAADTGLYKLLEGTGLRAEFAGDGAVRIVGDADPQSGSAAGDGADGTVEALIVTAQKREEDIQDVPIAISAFTQEQLENSQVAGGPDLMTQVPNFTFTKTNFSSYSIQIRGIGTQAISATVDPAVAVAFNNTPFIRNRFFEQEFYDLQRVEVLRGPQGTLYGRNATAGVVNVISNKPAFAYEAKVSGDVSNFNSRRLEGMINLPLVEDSVAVRLAGAWTKRDGYATNEITGNPIDGRDLWSTRLSLRFAPTDRIEANLVWEHFEEDDDRLRSGKQLCHRHVVTEIGGVAVPYGGDGLDPYNGQANFSQGCSPASLYAPESFEAPNGYAVPYYHGLNALTQFAIQGIDPYVSTTQSRDLRVIESTVDPEYRAKTDLVELQFSIDLNDNLTLTSETGYGTDRIFSLQDYNRFNTREGVFRRANADGPWAREDVLNENLEFCDPQLGCTSRLVAVDVSTAKSVQFSQEFRLGSDYEGPFNFSLGANFLRYDTEDKYYVFINTLSLYSALKANEPFFFIGANAPPWVPGVSDNHECLQPDGPDYPDPAVAQTLVGCVYIDPNPIGSLNDEGHNYFLSKNPYKLISYAVFGEAYYNITDNLKLTAGLRWTVDKKEAPRIPSWVIGVGTIGYPVAEVIEQEWREPTGRLTLDWKPALSFTDETLLYASYAHGYKAGGANPPAAGTVTYGAGETSQQIARESALNPKRFDPEFVDAFELGAKNNLLDGRLTVNLASFYYDYKGYQISYIVDRAAVNLNFDAEVWGLEIEADWRPLENLKLGFKGGYEQTRMADGSRAIDVMDRTAGQEGWIVLRPHPALSTNCIMPVSVITWGGFIDIPGGVGGGRLSGCEMAWLLGDDPQTWDPYVPFPNGPGGYPGYDPASAPPEANNGEGFFKDLSGNELPNAPNYTGTITADYTVPLPSDWLMTLHTDLYYQSEAWTRVFNTPGYDKLKAYTNVNLAAIFQNEGAGWKVMAYVKNVFDRDSITGAFLNSEDTGLTTNVFLTEPRLYGLRVTKEFSGGPWRTGANPNHAGPYPLTIEIGGQVQRHDAPNETITPTFADAFSDNLNTLDEAQHTDLDWGDGRDLTVTYRPGSGLWKMSAGLRYGRTNGSGPKLRTDEQSEAGCVFGGSYTSFCDKYPDNTVYNLTHLNWSRNYTRHQEQHEFADFAVGRDFALGSLAGSLAVGMRYARLESMTTLESIGTPDWYIPDGWFYKYDTTHTYYEAKLDAQREFKGVGPVLSWEASQAFLGDDTTGRLALAWTVEAGALFGKQDTAITGVEKKSLYELRGLRNIEGLSVPEDVITTPVDIHRSRSVTAPMLDLSLGLSYEIQRVKVGAGYRWERYFDVLDVGDDGAKDGDRTIDGPYFKLSVGFGG